MLGALGGDRLFELVGEVGEGGPVGWCVGLCVELGCEVGFSVAERFEAVAAPADPVLEEVGCELAVFEGLEVALELLLDERSSPESRKSVRLQRRSDASSPRRRRISCASSKVSSSRSGSWRPGCVSPFQRTRPL